MAERDWSEEIFNVLKNSEDLRAMGRAGSVQEQLAIHERMVQRQRERDNRDALQKANEIAERQAQSSRRRNRLLREQQEAAEAERLRLEALPKCPECQSPIDGDQPRRCAKCGSELRWFFGEPIDKHVIPERLTVAVRTRLGTLLQSLRSAAISFARTATRTHSGARLAAINHYETRLNQWASRACQDETAVRMRLREVNREQGTLHGPRSRAEAAVQSAPSQWGCATVMLVVMALGALWFVGMALDGPVEAKIIAYGLAVMCIFAGAASVFRASRAPAEAQRQLNKVLADIAALSRREDEERHALEHFSVRCGGTEVTPCAISHNTVFVQSAVGTHGPAVVGQALSELFQKLPASCRFADTEIEAEQFIDEAIASAAVANAQVFALDVERNCEGLAEGEGVLPKDVRDHLALVKTVVGRVSLDAMQLSRDTATIAVSEGAVRSFPRCLSEAAVTSSPPIERDTKPQKADTAGAALLDALCCVAVGDNNLNQQELDRIIDALAKLGVPLSKPRLQAVVIEACKRIHAKGVTAYASALCRHLVTSGNNGLCALVLEWQKKVAEADGQASEGEKEIVKFFEAQLAALAHASHPERYSDLDVAPPDL